MLRNKKKYFFLALLLFIYFNNTSLFTKPEASKPLLLAHRGLGQTFSHEGVTNNTNTASRIYKPQHPFLENTIPGIQAAFQYGADVVEFDVHATKDGQFAVFHDATLDYRTNASGEPENYTLQQLQLLDVGYGYTYDSGKTYPFRGKGVGLMPSLTQVLQQFPDKAFLIHLKSNGVADGELLASYLAKLPAERLKLLAVYGGDDAIEVIKKKAPQIRVSSKGIIKRSLIFYASVGWTGYIPNNLRNKDLIIPEQYARFLWGWPYRFQKRMADANTRIFLVKGNGDFSGGYDDTAALHSLPANYNGGIWTNRIDIIEPVYKGK